MSKLISVIGNRIVIKPLEEPNQTESGIFIPDSVDKKPNRGQVLAISKEVAEEGEIKEGDVVLYGKYAGTEVTLDNQKVLFMQPSDVLAIVE